MGESNYAVQATDREGRWVRCNHDRWQNKIVAKHSVMAVLADETAQTITSPIKVTQDKEFQRRRCLYGIVTVEGKLRYLKVVVEYKRDVLMRVAGWIVTAFPVAEIPPHEVVLWSK